MDYCNREAELTLPYRASLLRLWLLLLWATVCSLSTNAQTKINPNQITSGTLAATITYTGPNTHTGAETFGVINQATLNCKQLQAARCVDTANTAGWNGTELGGWLNSASSNLAGPGLILVSPGSYTLTTTVTPATGQQILCNGAEGSCIVTATGLATGNHAFSVLSKTDVRIAGFNILGPSAAGAGGSQNSIGIQSSTCTRCEYDHNYIQSFLFGISASPDTNGNIHDNWIFNIGSSGISAGNTAKTQIKNNWIDTVGSSALHHGIYLQEGDGVIADGNRISNVQGFCVVVQVNNGTGATLTNFQVVNNYCLNGGQASSGSRGGIVVTSIGSSTKVPSGITIAHNIIDSPGAGNPIVLGGSQDVAIDDNTIRNFQNDGIAVSGTLSFTTERITVTHNRLFNGTVAGNGIRGVVGGSVTRNVTVADNVIDGVFGSCIWFSNLSDSDIHDNRCKDWNIGGNVGNAGILLDTTNARTDVHDNTLSSANCTGSPPAIQVASGTRNQVHGNQMVNGCAILSDAGTATAKYDNIFSTGASAGKSAMTAGTVTVSTTEIQTGDFVQLSNCLLGGTAGILELGTIVNATSFVINSSNNADTSTVCWKIIH